jgi:putative ABC transport system substrate-binding protein
MTLGPFRRRFLRHSVAAVIALPGLAVAQAPGGTRRVAVMVASDPATASHLVKALVGGLAELGWVEGRNLRLDVRYGENDPVRFRRLADELLALRPDVFVTGNEPVARVVAPLTKTVPIVVPLGFDPVGAGLVKSLARPEGNVTGFSILGYELIPKRLQLLKQAVPGLKRVALMHRSGDANLDRVQKLLAEPARSLGLTIVLGGIRDEVDLELAFVQAAKQKADGVMSSADSFFFQHRVAFADLAVKHRLPSAGSGAENAMAGALFSYGANFAELFRRSAGLVNKILKGANPANIPVEQANVYDLVVNMKTARALGIKLPPSFMLQATRIVE